KGAEPVTLQRSPILTKRAPAPGTAPASVRPELVEGLSCLAPPAEKGSPSTGSGRTVWVMILRGNEHRLEPGEQRAGARSRDDARRAIAHRPGNGGDVQGSRPATTADDVDQSVLGPVADLRR